MAQKRRTNEEWRAVIKEQQASGQTQAKWCAARGIPVNTLRERARRQKREGVETKAREARGESASWMEVTPERISERPVSIRIEHGGFTIVVTEGIAAVELTEVLRAVSRVCC